MILHALFFVLCSIKVSAFIAHGCPDLRKTGCSSKYLEFRLHTETADSFQKITTEDIKSITFNPNAPIKVILHGYTGGADNPLMQSLITGEIKFLSSQSHDQIFSPAYLTYKKPVPNVIAVHYKEIARQGCYPMLFRNRFKLGECIANLIKAIVKRKPEEIRLQDFHLVGFSIGAQFAAQASNYLGEKYKLERITGLDPAWMFFFPLVTEKKERLNKNHAKFVDVVHTNTFWYGSPYNGGHYDFYMNGGRKQPDSEANNDNSKGYHKRAVEYFIESIKNEVTYYVYKIDCNLWLWMLGFCSENRSHTTKFGEYATVPSKQDEGSYMVYTKLEYVPE